MAKKRTKKQKQRAARKRQSALYTLDDLKTSSGKGELTPTAPGGLANPASVDSNQPRQPEDLFRFDKKLLYQDLRKSLIITLLLLGVLIGIYWYLRYN